jgi:poly(hydroxyalkanoate) depolymerase family esterase
MRLTRSIVPRTRPPGRSDPGTFRSAAGTLAYELYRPAVLRRPPPLFVMLHGGSQSAADFALGTRMNEIADECGGLVLYPEQSRGAHPLGCWNWYDTRHQSAGTGEPALIAGLTREIIAAHGVDAGRVYVAGLSAGGAMAVILGQACPELYAAVGVHSGVPSGVAHDVWSALQAMRDGPAAGAAGAAGAATRARSSSGPARGVSTIVFHGDRDQTVHPSNGGAILDQALRDSTLRRSVRPSTGASARAVTRISRRCRPDGDGADGELWLVHGAGHAWAGGDRRGSFTDEKGPDASREMARFFLKRRLRGCAAPQQGWLRAA